MKANQMFSHQELVLLDDMVGGRYEALNDLVIGGYLDPELKQAADELKPLAMHIKALLNDE